MSTAPVSPSAVPAPGGPVLTGLRAFAALTALGGILQLLLGLGILGSIGGVFSTHRMLGYITLGVSVLAALFAVLWASRSGNKGLMFHAITVAVLALAQVGLGEMGLRWVHVIVGILFFVAALALATLSFRSGGLGRAQRAAQQDASRA